MTLSGGSMVEHWICLQGLGLNPTLERASLNREKPKGLSVVC